MAKPITPEEITAYVEATWNKCQGEAWHREDIIKLAQEAGLIRAGKNYTEPARWGISEITDFYNRAVAAERQRIIAANAPEIEKINAHIKTLAAEREKVAQWMMTKGYATGHGESIQDLLKELEWQIEDRVKNIIRATGAS